MSTPRAKPKYYLTTPLYYTNGLPHIGHTYSTIVADVIRRYKRMRGFDVVHDHRGRRARRQRGALGEKGRKDAAGIFHGNCRAMEAALGRSWESRATNSFEPRMRGITAPCSGCSSAAGTMVSSKRATTPASIVCTTTPTSWTPVPAIPVPTCGRPTETVTEENYFFKLSEFQQKLLDFYAANPDFIKPESRRNEVLSFVQGGLRNLSITRTTIRWGIPVPGEAPHVFYVWFDALIGYLSAVGGPDYDERGLWPADLHIVGKEIIRFHAVYWPAFLMAADLPLPEQIWAHGWLLFDSEKMSKSRGNVVRPRPIVNVLGIEPLRYYLLREIVFGQDGSFSYDALVSRYNSDLANGLGNLASRTLTMIERYFGGEIPKPVAAAGQ